MTGGIAMSPCGTMYQLPDWERKTLVVHTKQLSMASLHPQTQRSLVALQQTILTTIRKQGGSKKYALIVGVHTRLYEDGNLSAAHHNLSSATSSPRLLVGALMIKNPINSYIILSDSQPDGTRAVRSRDICFFPEFLHRRSGSTETRNSYSNQAVRSK